MLYAASEVWPTVVGSMSSRRALIGSFLSSSTGRGCRREPLMLITAAAELLFTPMMKLRSIFSLYMHLPEAIRLRPTRAFQGSRPRKAKGARHNGGRTRGARFRTPEGSYLSFL